jgi:hypothetical protein
MSTPAPNEPNTQEAAVDQGLEADSTTEPDAGSDTEPHVLVSHCPAQRDNPRF